MPMLNEAARSLLLRAGGLKLMREAGRHGVRILLYHRFPETARHNLAKQCAHLRKHYHPVSLDDVADWALTGRALPPNSLAVTVDDGYRDFFTTAYPVFSSYGIPVTVFLTTGFLDRVDWLWVDRLLFAFRHAGVREARLDCVAPGRIFQLAAPEQRQRALMAVKEMAKRLAHSERMRLVLEEIPRLLHVKVPAEPPKEFAPLRWDEVREMTRHGISFGAHTITHPILSTLDSVGALRREIEGSKARLEAEVGRPAAHFSYPNGLAADVSQEAVGIVSKAGFRTAVLAEGGINTRQADPFRLRRNTVDPDTPALWFGRYATGFRREPAGACVHD